MKRIIIFTSLISIIVFTNTISAGGVSITPVHYEEFFEPGLEKSFEFQASNFDPTKGLNIYTKGDLAEYVNLSQTHFIGSGTFTATIKLPEKIEKPGTHKIFVGAIEEMKEEGVIGGVAAIQARIDILVPYPGKYAEATFKINNINKNEEAQYELKIQNLGTQEITLNPKIEIYKENKSNILISETLNETILKSKETLTIIKNLKTKNIPPGEYQAMATIDYGPKTIEINKTFLVGEFLVEVIDYDYLFEQGSINKFNIEIKNKWNTKINEVFAEVSITDQGKFITSFKTVSTSSEPWETQNLTGYLDATNLEAKRYTANIILSYDNKRTSKLVAIYINEPIKEINYLLYSATIGGTLILIILIYLIIKIRKLKKLVKKRNGKNN